MRPLSTLRGLFTLKAYAIVSTAVISGLIVAACSKTASQSGKQRFDEIDVQRINVIEPDGTLRMVLSNHAKLPDAIFKGKEYKGARGGDPGPGKFAGLIFFNSEGTEAGGLAYGSARTKDGLLAGGMLTMDQFEQNESIALAYREKNGQRSAGLAVMDEPSKSLATVIDSSAILQQLPDGPEKQERLQKMVAGATERGELGGAQRFFAGRDESKASVVDLRDGAGKTRLRMRVDSVGTARIEFLDADGKVTYSIGPDGKATPGSR